MASNSFSRSRRRVSLLAAGFLLFSFAPASTAQNSGSTGVLSTGTLPRVVAKRGGTAEVRVPFQLRDGYHTNSHTPSEEYLIPLRLTWEKGALELEGIEYPKPHLQKYAFSEKPLSVLTGGFEIVSKFKVPAGAPDGPGLLVGKMRYQACNDNACLPPKTLEVKIPLQIN